MAALPLVVDATSGRSKCKACAYLGDGDPTIKMGSKRVGIPGHAAGVSVYQWCHPACFVKHCLRVDYAPTNRAKCKGDGTQIPKGALRLLIGYKKESTIYKVENTFRTIVPELMALTGRSSLVIHGLDELSLDERQRVESCVYDGATVAPIEPSEQQPKVDSNKPKAKAKPKPKAPPKAAKPKQTKKRAREEEEKEEEEEEEKEGELLD